jgi:elongation factor P
MLSASELRPGMAVRLEREIYEVIAADYHAGGGKMGGVTHAKLKSLRTAALREWRFRGDEPVETVELDKQPMQFLYAEGPLCYFMNPESFEQVAVESEKLGRAVAYLTPETTVPVAFFEGEPLGIEFPPFVEARVRETAPPMHSQGTDNVWKQAVLENGVSILVPPFIAPGEWIKVDVEAGRYVERARRK